MKVKSESEVAQSCPTLSDPMDCSLPGSPVHGIFQARVLSDIKTNIQQRETKDEPQTNSSYKIGQIIIKIMEYTHTHLHP